MWLLSITHAIGKLGDVLLTRLPLLQGSFIRLLGEKSEFAQEAAAKGLAVVYDCSPPSSRDALVHDMIGTLVTGRKSGAASAFPSETAADGAGSTSTPSDTSIGQGPAGLALTAAGDTAYKELCSFANEVTLVLCCRDTPIYK